MSQNFVVICRFPAYNSAGAKGVPARRPTSPMLQSAPVAPSIAAAGAKELAASVQVGAAATAELPRPARAMSQADAAGDAQALDDAELIRPATSELASSVSKAEAFLEKVLSPDARPRPHVRVRVLATTTTTTTTAGFRPLLPASWCVPCTGRHH